MVVVRTDVHTDAVLTALRTGTGRPIGDARKPDGDPTYGVLYPISGVRDGSLEDPETDAILVYQVTCVAYDRAGAELLVGNVAEVMRTGFPIPGRSVVSIRLVGDGGVDPDHDVTPPLFSGKPQWRIWTTPA